MRRILRLLAVLGLVAVIVAVIRRLLAEGDDGPPPVAPWEPLARSGTDEPTPPAAEASSAVTAEPDAGDAGDADEPWTEPAADGSCPDGFPVKAKQSSKIFHVPGGQSYDRTGADRCYRDAAAAEADGLRQAKR